MAIKSKKDKRQYACQSCGHISPKWIGRCPECEAWNSFVEELVPVSFSANSRIALSDRSQPQQLSEISFEEDARKLTRLQELNRVLGGGIVSGSVILVGGDPGVGKSTLMLQIGATLASADYRVLYVSGEESVRQTKLRAERLGVVSDNFYIFAETDLNLIEAAIERLQPALVVIDSIQTVYQPIFESSPGSISQVRECALALSQMAKQKNIPVFLVGHVTKEGYIAGPKVLEHMVDVLLSFEGDGQHLYRILRATKNRFGSTREFGVFEMKQDGLHEVANPSALFLAQRKENISGSTVVCTMEGTRPFLVEIQALATPTSYGTPQRTATGVDNKRLALLLAVLEKRIGLRLGASDVFVNAAGGVRIDEPSADLGILAAIASSHQDHIVDPHAVIVGEIGLGGEIRAVPQIDKRIEEAAKLGFERIVIPKYNAKGLDAPSSIAVVTVERAEEALEEVLN